MFGQKSLIFITLNVESTSINFKFGHVEENAKAITLLIGQTWLIIITFQSAIKFN